MAKLKDLKINLIPKLDFAKTRAISKKIGAIFKKSVGVIGKVKGKADKAMAKASKGLELLDQLKVILGKTNNLVSGLVSKGDSVADIASMGNVSAGQVYSLYKGLGSGSSRENTEELFNTFLNKTNGEKISGIDKNGNEYTSIDTFLSVLDTLDDLKSIQNSDASQEEKDKARADEGKIIDKYFGGKKGKALQDAIASVKDYDKNKLSISKQADATIGANRSESVDSAIGKIKLDAEIAQLSLAAKKGLLSIQEVMAMIQAQKELNDLSASSADEMMTVQSTFDQIEDMIKTLLTESANFISKFQKVFDIIIKMVTGVLDMVTKVLNFLSFSKPPTEESFNKMLEKNLRQRDKLLSRINSPSYNPSEKQKADDIVAIDKLLGKFKYLFSDMNPDETKYAIDDKQLRRILTESGYRPNP